MAIDCKTFRIKKSTLINIPAIKYSDTVDERTNESNNNEDEQMQQELNEEREPLTPEQVSEDSNENLYDLLGYYDDEGQDPTYKEETTRSEYAKISLERFAQELDRY
jgi:hypothetical protein